MQKVSIKKNFILSTAYQLLLIVAPLVTAPYVARVLGPDRVGIYSATNSIQMYFSLFAALGTASYGAREISRARDDEAKRSKLFWEIELLTVATTLVILVIWGAWIAVAPEYKIYYLVLTLNLFNTMFDISWFFKGLEQFSYTVRQNTIFKLLGIVLLFILIKDESHIATKNLDELNDYFYKVINVSATPKTKPDVLITEFEAIEANLIKNIVFKDGDKTYDSFDNESLQFSELRGALTEFIKVKEKYHKFNINPCFIIQISNTELGQKQFDSIMSIFKENDFKDLKYVSMAQDPKLCTTNDQLIKAAPTKWEKYVVRNDSLIDVIIFKMVIWRMKQLAGFH